VRGPRPEDEVARLRARCEELERANRAKDRMLAVLGHDLRAPLSAILGWTSRLRGENLDGAQTARALETIERNARTQQKLIDQVMEASRVAAERLQMVLAPVDLGVVVETVVEGFLPAAAERRIELAYHAIDGVTVMADRTRIEQVVTNLIGNALKYTEAGGHVTVSVKRENKRSCLVVRDDGQGIEAALLPRVFDLWVQDDSAPVAKSGLGLGLHIVKNIVERHGGTVSAESEGPGHGSTFTVRLGLYSGSVSGTRAKHRP
jgi:signal transduction histidine kinase